MATKKNIKPQKTKIQANVKDLHKPISISSNENSRDKLQINEGQELSGKENPSEKQNKSKRNKLSKKQMVLLVSISATVFVLLVVAIVLIVVFAFPKIDSNPNEYSSPLRKNYNYAIDITDSSGIQLDSSLLGELDYSDISIVQEPQEYFTISSDLIMNFNDTTIRQPGVNVGITFLHGTEEVATMLVRVLENSIYLTSALELQNIVDEATGVYVLADNIDLASQECTIKNFKGKFYGNHKRISNLSLGNNGGLFIDADGAEISGIHLINAIGEYTYDGETLYYGTLANRITNTDIRNCLATGNINIKIEKESAYSSIGGLVGHSEGSPRIRNVDVSKEITYSQADVNISIVAKGSVSVGGVVGISINCSVDNSYSLGDIQLQSNNGVNLSSVRVGGIVGSLLKSYEPLVAVTDLDAGQRLYSYSDIVIEIYGGGDGIMICAGGIYGSLTNHSVFNSSYNGEMHLRSSDCNLRAGGLVGEAINSTSFSMSISGITINAIVDVKSSGGVYAGGLAGVVELVTYSSITKVPTPTLEGTSERPQVINQYVALEDI